MTKSYHPIRSLVWKEWREQRWRFALSALVLTTLSASMVRAQLIPTAESVAIIFGPLGLVLSVFMSMGAVPPERAARTWHFLVTQPMAYGRILIVKWAVGALSLVATLVIAGLAAFTAARSRGEISWPPVRYDDLPILLRGDTAFLLISLVGSACSGYLAMYSILFAVMLKARNELHAGLAGILITIVILAWAAQYPLANTIYQGATAIVAFSFSLPNPIIPLHLQFSHNPWIHGLSIAWAPLIWAGIPILIWLSRQREAS